ncbi:class I SAM-dependent methyltransferase [uncultured Ramlibacter sp.]|uniref:class I SAM-dependent methyltransferase n=1 Tax=uncultured Ramlibacter sp. TaxID=260755 RepID=UPI0026341A5D|nr:class I SAM-dependent methyltransferase [uncultured Ramlibacter sp.]
MATVLVAERAPADAHVLVVGAGGGAELKAFAQAHAGWRFTGVDPAQEMLRMARTTLGPLAGRAQLHHGYVDTAPDGPFDAATCLLTLHFVAVAERKRTLQEIHRRLRPGAPFVMAHLSFPQAAGERDIWLARYVAFAVASGVDPASVRNAASVISDRLSLLDPAAEEAQLQDAGFSVPRLFYTGLAFRGWVAQA